MNPVLQNNSQKTANDYFNQGNQFKQSEQYQDAVEAYEKAIELNPNFSWYYHNLAEVFFELEEWEKASNCFHKACEINPNSEWSFYQLGEVLVQQGQLEEAIAVFQTAIEINSGYAEFYSSLGEILWQAERLEEAEKTLQKAVELDPDSVKAYQYLWEVLAKQGKGDEGLVYLQKAVELNPGSWELHQKLGEVWHSKRDLVAAEKQYRTVIQLNSDYHWGYYKLGVILREQGKVEEAIAYLQKAVKLEPSSAICHHYLGHSLSVLQRWEEAIECYRKAIELSPESAIIYQHLGDAFVQQEQLEEATSCYEQYVKLDPEFRQTSSEFKKKFSKLKQELKFAGLEGYVDEVDGLVVRGWVWNSQQPNKALNVVIVDDNGNQIAQTIAKNQRADLKNRGIGTGEYGFCFCLPLETTELDSRDLKVIVKEYDWVLTNGNIYIDYQIPEDLEKWEIYHNLGNQLQVRGLLSEAVPVYKIAIQKNPNFAASYHNLADTLLKQEEWEKAISYYLQAWEKRPNYFWSLHNLATAYSQLEKWNQAISYYHKSLSLYPDYSSFIAKSYRDTLASRYNYKIEEADLYWEKGDFDRGEYYYKEAIEFYKQELHWILPKVDYQRIYSSNPYVILVVEDSLPQCFRYRVQQKIEQFNLVNFSVKLFSMRELQQAKNELFFCDAVIFYRVPAYPDIIEIIQYAKAINKITFYDIDDLIFDRQKYPEAIESYGGQVAEKEYLGLVKGTILFQEAMALCDYAIASTPTLAEEMKKIVGRKTCFVHRNGLDSLNSRFLDSSPQKLPRDYISIFYGSGTKAHDADFHRLAAPAIARLMQKYPQVRLTVIGYKTFPKILTPYLDRIDFIEAIHDVEVYWEFLAQADINIAMLSSKQVNDCKSEIKWLEAASLGVPSVVSITKTYQEILTHGKDVLFAKTVEDWFQNLEKLVIDHQLRQKIAQTAYKTAWTDYNISNLASNLKDIIQAGIPSTASNVSVEPSSSKKKILIVNVFYPPQEIGGGTRIVKDNVDILNAHYRDTYEIYVFTSDHRNPIPYQLSEYTHEGIHVTKLSVPEVARRDLHYQDDRVYEIFSHYLKFNQPDLIHFHCIQMLTASMLAAALDYKIPYLITVHDAWWISEHQFLVDNQGEVCNLQQNDPIIAAQTAEDVGSCIKRQRYLAKYLNKAQRILAVSQRFAKIYRQNGFPQTETNRNGIIPKPVLPRKPSPTGRVRLGHAGGISAHKGYYLLKEAVEKANLSQTEIIAVDLSQTDEVILREEQWGSTPVKIIARVEPSKMPEFFSTIDVLVAPSIWPESFGLITREAAAAGVWVIASDKGALAEDIVDGVNGDIFSTDNIDELIDILQRIDEQPEQYQQLIKAEVHVRTTEEQVRELCKIYEDIL